MHSILLPAADTQPACLLTLLNSHLQLEETANHKPFDPAAQSMEEPFFTQWKQAQVTRVNTFFTEPTAGWKLQIHAKAEGPNMA